MMHNYGDIAGLHGPPGIDGHSCIYGTNGTSTCIPGVAFDWDDGSACAAGTSTVGCADEVPQHPPRPFLPPIVLLCRAISQIADPSAGRART
jgi:hypothetical protein